MSTLAVMRGCNVSDRARIRIRLSGLLCAQAVVLVARERRVGIIVVAGQAYMAPVKSARCIQRYADLTL